MHINVIFDTVCPWCFIGKRRLEEALRQAPQDNLEISWQAFLLNPDMPLGGMDQTAYLAAKFGGEERLRRVYKAVADAGRSSGIAFAFDAISRAPNSIDSHRLVRFAAKYERGGEAVERLYQDYFLNGRDIGARGVLIQIAEDLGLNPEEFRAYLYGGGDIDEIQEENTRAHRFGISGVPAFVIDGQFTVSGAQEPAVLKRIFDVAAERRQELMESGTQPL